MSFKASVVKEHLITCKVFVEFKDEVSEVNVHQEVY